MYIPKNYTVNLMEKKEEVRGEKDWIEALERIGLI